MHTAARSTILDVMRRVGAIGVLTALVNRWYTLVKSYSRWRGRSPIDAVYSRQYFVAETDMTRPTAKAVAECLMKEFTPRSVVDVGCGTAVYLREFERYGVEVAGYEGSRHAIADALISPTKIRHADLSQPLSEQSLSTPYDLVISFEVGEHLPAHSAPTFVRNITQLGSTVAFSAAQPLQGGVDHINEQPPQYWISLFERYGYRYKSDQTERLRTNMSQRKTVWWLPKNVLVFEAA